MASGSPNWWLVWIFVLLLIAVSVGYTAIAIANTLMMANADRLHDLWVLRLAGATKRQTLWTVAPSPRSSSVRGPSWARP